MHLLYRLLTVWMPVGLVLTVCTRAKLSNTASTIDMSFSSCHTVGGAEGKSIDASK